jgi:hypothetical protein
VTWLHKLPFTLADLDFQLAEAFFEPLHFALRLGGLSHGDDREDENQDDQTEDDEYGEAFHGTDAGMMVPRCRLPSQNGGGTRIDKV